MVGVRPTFLADHDLACASLCAATTGSRPLLSLAGFQLAVGSTCIGDEIVDRCFRQ